MTAITISAEDKATTRSSRTAVTELRAATSSEWIKYSSVWSNKAIFILTAAIGASAAFAVAKLMTDQILLVSDVFAFSSLFTSMIAAVSGILIFTSEMQHGTLGPTLAAQPNRSMIALAKMTIAAIVGTILGLAGMAFGFLGGWIGGLEMGSASTMAQTAGWALLYTSVAAILGIGVGMIARHGALAISALLIWAMIIEGLLFTFIPSEISRFLPFLAGDEMLGLEIDFDSSEAAIATLTRGEGAVVFIGYSAIAMVVGTVLLTRRDSN